MARGFFLKLALTNLRRNRKLTFPYFIASTIMVGVYFMVMMILYSRSIGNLDYGKTIQQMFGMGHVIMTILIGIFMLYINSFLLKGRKKEFGLYGILGLEKRHVGRVIFWENLILSSASLLLGILAGSVFSKLVFLLLLFAFRVVAAGTTFLLPWQAFAFTGAIFAGSFILTTVINLLHISLANPVDLLRGKQKGEKKVRFVIPQTFIGLTILAWAYYIALRADNPLAAMNQFFLAVVLVIAATYILFRSGSVFLLKILRNNKRLYYKPNNFVAISSMFHRMKQNAAGLASICILSTMVLVTVACSASLFIGQENILADMFSYDVEIIMNQEITQEQLADLNELIASLEKKHRVLVEDRHSYTFGKTFKMLKNGEFTTPDIRQYQTIINYLVDITIIPLTDYNRYSQNKETLSDNEILVLSSKESRIPDVFNVGENQYRTKARIDDSIFSQGKEVYGGSPYIVVRDEDAMAQMLSDFNEDSPLRETTAFNLQGNNERGLKFAQELRQGISAIGNVQKISDIFTYRIDGYGIYGGLVFLGSFFTILFLSATILIIYFKQVSEGYDDQERFAILQKVGMDDQEVKRTITKQILIVFFLPLAVAFLHILAASPMIMKMLQVFSLFNTTLAAACIAATCLLFALVYVVVFRLTARTYYGIVKW